MTGERGDLVLEQLAVFRVIAELNERDQQLGSLKAYAYPQSLGEWLGTAVQLAGSVSWQAYYALQPLVTQGDHERRIAAQGRGMIELYGAVLVGTLDACDTALDQEVTPELEIQLPEISSVVEMWDEARDERHSLKLFYRGARGGDLGLRHLPRPRRRADADDRDQAARSGRLRRARARRRRRARADVLVDTPAGAPGRSPKRTA